MAAASSTEDVAALISHLKSLESSPPTDETTRKELYRALRGASLAIEAPLETVHRISFAPMELAVAKVGSDLNLFAVLESSHGKSMGTIQLAKATGSNPDLLIRLLRYLAAVGIIEEVSEEQFSTTKITSVLAQPGLMAGAIHSFQNINPCWDAMPQFLADNKYQPPSDNTHTVFQAAHHTDLPAFVWVFQQAPARIENFALWMSAQRTGQKDWLDVVPFAKLCRNEEPEKAVFVDIGGSIGHQCAALKAKFPDLPGRIIYQDMAPVISMGLKIPGVEPMVHDFWTPQPVQGACIYYLRNILHDYPDERCMALLKNTVEAMDPNSLILIDEIILSDYKANLHAMENDLTMMVTLAGAERTDRQWRALLDAAGLKIQEIYTYTEDTRDSIIVAVRK